MKAQVKWKNDLEFEAVLESGHSLSFSAEGNNPSPMEVLLASVGGCSSIDVMTILKQGRQDVTGCVCDLTTERAEKAPRVFTSIHAYFKVTGNNLNEKKVERACKLSFDKYCSVSLMLGGKVDITHSYSVESSE